MADILLEAGTNELELLVFRLGATPFGVNVAKVREILQRPEVIKIPQAPGAVEGSFKLREEVLTLVNLGRHFGMEGDESASGRGLIVIVEFNQVRCGILVDAVEMIHRLHWDAISPPSPYLAHFNAPITGVAHVEKKIVLILDFESIIGEILGAPTVQEVVPNTQGGVDRRNVRIVLADDSSVLRSAVTRVLKASGFENLTVCTDGQEAWEAIDARRSDPQGAFDLILTDIEMPRMDGLHLTSKVKGDAALKNIPVVLFSSLITDDNRKKGAAVGADAQLSKPDSPAMIEAIEGCLRSRGFAI